MGITANPNYRVFYTVWAFFECIGFGGLIYGWGSLVYVLKEEGIYADLCSDEAVNGNSATSLLSDSSNGTSEEKGCDSQDSRLALVFTIGSGMLGLGSFLIGQINFKFGTRISRIVAILIFMGGALLTAFTSKETPWLIFPGLSFLGFGGIAFLMTNTQIANLYPVGGAAVVGILCGGFDSSAGIQLMVKLGYEGGISVQTSYIIIGCTCVLTFISTFLFLPKDFIHKELPSNIKLNRSFVVYEQDVGLGDEGDVEKRPVEKAMANAIEEGKKKETQLDTTEENTKGRDGVRKSDDKENKTEEKEPESGSLADLKKHVFSMTYGLHVLWLAILQLRFYFFLGTVNSRLESLLDTKSEVSHYTNVLLYVMMGGLVASPFAGFFYGVQYKFFKNETTHIRRHAMPAVLPLTVASVLCLVMSGLILVEQAQIMYPVFVLLLIFRSFLYTMAAGYISALFPSAYFGILYGLMVVIGAVISLIQYPLFSWAEDHGFLEANIFLLVLTCVTFVHPAYQWWACRRQTEL